MNTLHVLAGFGLAAGLVAAGCGGGGASPAATAAPKTAQTQAQEVVIKASEWKFEPSIVRLKAGQPVKLVFQNWGQEDHDLVFKGLQAQPGDKQENVQELAGWAKQSATGHKEEMDEHHEKEGMGNMHMDAEAGHMSSFVVTPTKPGTYELVCSYEGHTEQGQKATLIVQ
ncbi:MAG: cupredoxin domain-containing protein [Chloroflexi bacterium]|nr:cupredoxin domain-containing protein [Chloroflexota bacterium]